MASSTAWRASPSLSWLPIEPDRSSTKPRLTGGRRRDGSGATVGATRSIEQEALAAAVGADERGGPAGRRGADRAGGGWWWGWLSLAVMACLSVAQGSSSNRSRAIRASRSTSLLERRSSGRRTWISMSGVMDRRSQVLRSTVWGRARTPAAGPGSTWGRGLAAVAGAGATGSDPGASRIGNSSGTSRIAASAWRAGCAGADRGRRRGWS